MAKFKVKNGRYGPDFIAPDSGWGWVVCLAVGLSNFVSQPLLQQFGLFFTDKFLSMGMSNTKTALIINLQLSISSCVGLLNGPINRYFSYRQVAFFSSLVIVLGLFLLSTANSFLIYILSFSVLYGIGFGFNFAANSLALNTYFKEKRRISTGFSMTITALGTILFPYVITIMLPIYGVQGTVLIFCALALNGTAFALIYQPVEWHTKTNLKHTHTEVLEENTDAAMKLNIFQRTVEFFDLDLLRDFSFINLMVGLNIAMCTELYYSILTPFILADYNFSKSQIATIMSVIGLMDIITRFCFPFAANYIGWQNKTFFMLSVLGISIGRIFIAHFQSFWYVLFASTWIGFNKGARSVFSELVIPTYVPLNRLPAAIGLKFLFAGLFYISFGPAIGWIRDVSNYTVTLHCLNVSSYLTCISWTAEKYFHMYRNKKVNALPKENYDLNGNL